MIFFALSLNIFIIRLETCARLSLLMRKIYQVWCNVAERDFEATITV